MPSHPVPATTSPLITRSPEATMSTLEIRDLHVSVDTESGPKEILRAST